MERKKAYRGDSNARRRIADGGRRLGQIGFSAGSEPARSGPSRWMDVAEAIVDIRQMEGKERQERALGDAGGCLRWVFEAVGSHRVLGILSGCAISGCDVHTITPNANLLKHFGREEALPAGFRAARECLRGCAPNTIAIVVYEDRFEELSLDGTRRRIQMGG
jgi:hypothetical protein